MKRQIILICLGVFPSVFLPTAFSEERPMRVALETVVSEVLEKNPDAKFYAAEIRAARGEVITASASPNPHAG